MGQNRDSLTHELCQRGGEKSYVLLCTGGQLALHALLGLFSWRGVTASLIYFLLLRWAKCWFWPFCLHPQKSLGRACLYIWPGAWRGCLASRWGMDQLPGLLPTTEFRESGKTSVPCSVIQQLMGISPKPGVVGGQPAQETWGGFTVSGSKFGSSKRAGASANGNVAWEQLLGPVGHVALTSFLNKAFLLVDLKSFPIHDVALCRL